MAPAECKVVFSDGGTREGVVEPGKADAGCLGTGMAQVRCARDGSVVEVFRNTEPAMWKETKDGKRKLISQVTVRLKPGEKLTLTEDHGYNKKGQPLEDVLTVKHTG